MNNDLGKFGKARFLYHYANSIYYLFQPSVEHTKENESKTITIKKVSHLSLRCNDILRFFFTCGTNDRRMKY